MIIYHLRKHKGTLATCCLTCKTWRPTARHYLLRHVRLTTEHAYDRFVDALDHSPNLPACVRSLTIKRGHVPHSDPFEFSSVLLRVTQLSHLHLKFATRVVICTSPIVNTVYPFLSTIILRGGIYHGPNIARLLSACPTLRTVRLIDVDGGPVDDVPPSFHIDSGGDTPPTFDFGASLEPSYWDIPSSTIQELVFLRVSESVEYYLLHGAIRFKFQLQSLEIDYDFGAEHACPQILWDSQSSLRTLVLHHIPDSDIDHFSAGAPPTAPQ
ncbi:hypothetical protein EVJ58_g1724 [Rhodofomes roseus]|uniref:F-box domain-containing protein n=1 Tax=Rhodofomes roseus TaxID=34475 RepID=A0A4Y9YYC8_9APHY|nr:hypothetical protein EVJ58_g1724 [Rhodofomes roseus]